MASNTRIEWCDHTFNPWWGCTKVSPGCAHCYAETLATRFGQTCWGPRAPRRTFGAAHWREPLAWNARAAATGQRARVFCASMADVFEDRRELDPERARLWALIEATPHLDWLLLTKRPERILALIPPAWRATPPANVWYGTSVESPAVVGRIAALRQVPATIRFLSAEPLLAPLPALDLEGIHWVIVGGESGAGARPMAAAWARALRDQCRAAGVAFFVKQMGSVWARAQGLRGNGGALAALPPDLRLREVPPVARRAEYGVDRIDAAGTAGAAGAGDEALNGARIERADAAVARPRRRLSDAT